MTYNPPKAGKKEFRLRGVRAQRQIGKLHCVGGVREGARNGKRLAGERNRGSCLSK